MRPKISDSLWTEYDRFRSAFNFAPTRVYLGVDEFLSLREEARQFINMTGATDHPLTRMTWRGMPIYQVDADHWMGFGIDCPSPAS